MDGEIRKVFKEIIGKKPVEGLSDRVIFHIRQAREKRQRMKYILLSSSGVLGIIASLSALYFSASHILQSEFFQYISLILSDGKEVLSNISDYGQIILESVPFMSVLGIFVGILVALVSIRISLLQIYGQREQRKLIHV
ncbi:MAG: hypothetical protein WCP15_01475 [bacterium]